MIAMVMYHFSYDLAYFVHLFDVRFLWSGLGLAAGRAIGTTFIFLAGLSLTLSYRRAAVRSPSRQGLFRKYLRRGVRIFSYGLLITLVTWILLPEGIIVFGVLHLIGASIILAYPFLRLRLPNVVLGVGCIIVGLYLSTLRTDQVWLMWLGIGPDFFTLDYWPIFPWFGVVLLGIFVGNVLYGGEKRATVGPIPEVPGIRPLAFLGRHSLPVYLAHQPVLIATLVLLGLARLP